MPRRTKIVCTIGPSSSRRGVIEKLLRAGMDVARLNFSHGTHEQHAGVIADLRELSERMDRPLAILQDLSGPKVRLGTFEVASHTIKRGQEVGFCCGDTHAEARALFPADDGRLILPLPVPELLEVLKPGNTLLLDDGNLNFRVTCCEGGPEGERRLVWARCRVGGTLKPRKGVTAPGVTFAVPAVTDKDKDDLRFGLAKGVDWVAASYVREASDVAPLREVMAEVGIRRPIIAKIEKAEAVRNLNAILNVVDGLMVARGDMGVEMPFDEVPLVQKRIIRACNREGKPVITATQMLESMIHNPRPTRAEATDVANAILDGTDAVMLSGETAAGEYPVEAVRAMSRIAVRAEEAMYLDKHFEERLPEPDNTTDAVAAATAHIAEQINAKAIVCATTSGSTARRVAQYRPDVPILAVSTEKTTYRQLALTWGVKPFFSGTVTDTDAMVRATVSAAVKSKLAAEGDTIVVTAGTPVNNPGTTNLIKVHVVGQPLGPARPEH